MVYQPILLLMVLLVAFQEVCSYYLYNPYTHDILVLSSLANVPSGYKLIPPPYERRSSQQGDQNHIGQCSDPGFFCIKPYDSLQTYQFHCSKDSQCPHFYKCCRHRCFVHRICVKATIQSKDTHRNPPNTNLQRQGTCEKWPYSCHTPYHHSLTSIFKCENDKQCPKAFKCCQQSCFEHKICSKAIAYKHEYVEDLRWNETKDIKKPAVIGTDENDLIHISTTELSTTTVTGEETSEVETTEAESTEVETPKDEITDVETTEGETTEGETTEDETTEGKTTEGETTEGKTTESETTEDETTKDETTEVETTEVETTEVETTEYVEELEATTTSDEPGFESTDTTIENASETTYGDNYVSSETTDITTGIEYVRSNSTEKEKKAPSEYPSFHSTPDPNAINPEYSDFYEYYDDKNEPEYDTDSNYT